MAQPSHSGVRRAEKQSRRRKRRAARAAAGVVALSAVAAVGLGQSMGQGQAQAAGVSDVVNAIVTGAGAVAGVWKIDLCGAPSTVGNADCSGASNIGIAIVLPDEVAVIPSNSNVSHGSAKVIGSGYEFAMAAREGNATAIAYLPASLATAGASDGRTAWSFAVLGMANAWTTDDIKVTAWKGGSKLGVIPGVKAVGCYGGVTAAYAEGVGACANVLGTFDFRYQELDQNKEPLSIKQVQFALTDPTAVLSDPSGVFTTVITDLLNGETPTLSKDFIRLSLGGDAKDAYGLPVLVSVTSDYGPQREMVVHWLGSSLTLNPNTVVNGETKANHVGIPVIHLGDLDTAELVPSVSIPQIDYPFGIPSIGPYETSSVTGTQVAAPAAARTLIAETTDQPGASDQPTATEKPTITEKPATTEKPAVTSLVEPTPGTGPSDTADDSSGGATTPGTPGGQSVGGGYVGKHRSPESYFGKHRAPQAPTVTGSESDGDSTDKASTDKASTDKASTDKGSTGSDTGTTTSSAGTGSGNAD
ncbi:hypothetical protein ACWDTD_08565 [Gordonia sp. NPDC003425]